MRTSQTSKRPAQVISSDWSVGVTRCARRAASRQNRRWQTAPRGRDARPQLGTGREDVTSHGTTTVSMATAKDSPVASFLCPLNTCSSSFRFLMSNSLHKWSRDAVSSQLPFRFHFTSITVFLWAWLKQTNTRQQDSSTRTCPHQRIDS